MDSEGSQGRKRGMGNTRKSGKHQKAKPSEVGKTLERRLGSTPAQRATREGTPQSSSDAHSGQPHVLERSDLAELLALAELDGRSFGSDATIVNASSFTNPAPTSSRSRELRLEAEARVHDTLRMPRRPTWSSRVSAQELQRMESDAFLQWRRSLAQIEESERDHISLTPFEKNLNIWRQLWRVIERSHAVAQIVDARDPLLYRCNDLEQYVREIHPLKRNILVLNKADLVPRPLLGRWASYFRAHNVVFALFSAEASNDEGDEREQWKDNYRNESDENNDDAPSATARIKSTSALLDFLEHHAAASKAAMEEHGDEESRFLIPRSDRPVVGLVGYPNVGKTSTLNAMLGRKQAATSVTPGKTKHFQTINTHKTLRIADSPGLVFPQFSSSQAELVAAAVISIDNLTDLVSPVALIASRIPRSEFERGYNMRLPKPQPHEKQDRQPNAAELMAGLARARGYMRDRGMPDESRAAKALLRDYASGKISYCFEPPKEEDRELRCRGMGVVWGGRSGSDTVSEEQTEESARRVHEAAEMLAGVRLGEAIMDGRAKQGQKQRQEGKEHKKAQKKAPRVKGRKVEKERRRKGIDFQSPSGAMAL